MGRSRPHPMDTQSPQRWAISRRWKHDLCPSGYWYRSMELAGTTRSISDWTLIRQAARGPDRRERQTAPSTGCGDQRQGRAPLRANSSALPWLTSRPSPPDRGITVSWLFLVLRILTGMARPRAPGRAESRIEELREANSATLDEDADHGWHLSPGSDVENARMGQTTPE